MRARVAVIADIHGNMFALDAVEVDLSAQGIDAVLVAGDLVGRGPMGSAVVARVMERGWPCIRGNHEDYLLSFRRGAVDPSWLLSDEWSCSRWMAAELSDAAVDFISALPDTMTSPHAPALRIVHGSSRSNNEGLGPWTPDAELEAHLAAFAEAMLVCAHIHRPMHRQLPSGGEVVNVSSVGLPFNGDWYAQYVIFELCDGRWSVEFRRVPWDREGLLAHYQASGFEAEGGITARLLRREVERARPALVPFLRWARVTGHEPVAASLPGFDAVYDPDRPLAEFEAYLATLGGR